MSGLSAVQNWLQSAGLTGLVVPSTDEFLSEFPPPADRRLQWVTGFRGSTGMAIILSNAAALFLDGRYRQQGVVDVRGKNIAIEAATLASRNEWLRRCLEPNASIGIDARLHSASDVLQWQSSASEQGFTLQFLRENPIDRLWSDARPEQYRPHIIDYPVQYAGESFQAKCAALVAHARASGLHALVIADPEDVSWVLNVRVADEAVQTEVGEWHIVPSCRSRLLVRSNGCITWFVDSELLTSRVLERDAAVVTVAAPERFEMTLHDEVLCGPIGVDSHRTSAAFTAIIEQTRKLVHDGYVARQRWRKHAVEVQVAQRAHINDAAAVIRFMAWLTRVVPDRGVSEFEAAEMLERFRREHADYIGPSMPLMSASGPNGSQPHYVPRRDHCRQLNDHPIFWMDSGGHYRGGTTDNTFTLALGVPEAKHVFAHTRVLQAFIALATARVPVGTYGVQLDTIARQVLWREGMDFAHGTGHGVGNCLNIHEGPHIGREPGPGTTAPIVPGMIVTNEPGYYVDDDFGLRIESHMVVVVSDRPNFLEFQTISRLPIDPRLVDFERLSQAERLWLAAYHRTVLADVERLLDGTSAVWLKSVTLKYDNAAREA